MGTAQVGGTKSKMAVPELQRRDAQSFQEAVGKAKSLNPWVVAFSGGKDSTALLLWALSHHPPEEVVSVFCDTGAEWPETYAYLDYIEKKLNTRIEKVGYPGGLAALIYSAKMFPSPTFRFCTSRLKTRPLGKWCQEHAPNGVVLMGQRREESVNRAGLPFWSDTGSLKIDYLKMPLFRPILYWSKTEVLNSIRQAGLKLNPVYRYVSRANCGICVMAAGRQVGQFCQQHPAQAEAFLNLERALGKPWRPGLWLRDVATKSLSQLSLFDWDTAEGCWQDGFCDLSEEDHIGPHSP